MCLLIAIALAAVSGNAAAGILKVGSPADSNNGNCAPFGCGFNTEYQQVYAAGAFSGPVTIDALNFYNSQVNSSATAISSGNWQIALSTTGEDWNTLSTTPSLNVGADNSLVFNGNLSQSWAFRDTLTINLKSPFTYDPSKGNLLMDVISSGLPTSGYSSIYFDTNGFDGGMYDGNSIMGRLYQSANNPGFITNSGYGLVTGFDTVVTSVPAPPTVLLIGPGLIALASRRRKLSQYT